MKKTKIHSFNTKITFAFLTIGFILLLILFVQIIPRMITEEKEQKQQQMEHMISLTKNQLQFARELLINERRDSVSRLEKWFYEQSSATLQAYESSQNKTTLLNDLAQTNGCKVYVVNSQDKTLQQSHKTALSHNKIEAIQKNKLHFFTDNQTHMCPKKTRSILFQHFLNNGHRLIMECAPQIFKSEHQSLEQRIKKDLQESFKLTYEDHQGKINLLWINTKHPYVDSQPLYHINDKTYNEKYCMSKMSSATVPQTGYLSAQEIMNAANQEPIRHVIQKNDNPSDTKEALTWVKSLHDKGDKQFFFIVTVFVEDFNKNLYEPLLKVMPAGIFALFTAILLGLIIFRRMFKSINVLTHTVKEVNQGNRSVRNHLKGDDDIVLLANAFDSMLDSIEENISQLDQKVELKTQLLQNSLQEKETLLKEIHHRVKNNLAMTINLIKLQKVKLKDETSKEILTDIQERIFTMELLHRKLYESKNLSSICMQKYVQDLLQDLSKSYQSDKKIECLHFIDGVTMDIEYAMPCGLIITECLINSFKYAFDAKEGKIEVKITQHDSKYELEVSDNGKGLPKDLDIYSAKSLGLRLITSIVQGQLLGTISHCNEEGTKYKIEFSINQLR